MILVNETRYEAETFCHEGRWYAHAEFLGHRIGTELCETELDAAENLVQLISARIASFQHGCLLLKLAIQMKLQTTQEGV